MEEISYHDQPSLRIKTFGSESFVAVETPMHRLNSEATRISTTGDSSFNVYSSLKSSLSIYF